MISTDQGTPRSRIGLITALMLAAAATGSRTVPVLAVPLTSCQSTWNLVNSPSPGVGENVLDAIAASGHNDAWAVGNVQMTSAGVRQTLTEHWDGTSWSVVGSPNTGAGDNNLYGVAAIAPGNAWVVGRSYAAASGSPSQGLVEHWNGSSWSIVPVPQVGAQDNVLGGVAATSANDVWAVGYSTPSLGALQTLIEHWNGAGWSVVQAPPPPGNGNNLLIAVAAVSPSDAWAVGAYNQTATAAAVSLVEHWNGTSWSIVASPPNVPGTTGDNFLASVAEVAANDVWAAGYGDTTQFSATNPNPPSKTLAEHWDGATWSVVNSQNVTGDDAFFAVSATPGQGNAWAVGASKSATVFQPLLERWNGSTFVSVISPNPNPAGGQLTAVMALSPNDVWSTGGSGTTGNFRTLIENYCVPPVVTAITPTSGKPGTAVTVTGSGFLGASGVNFGSAPSASFTVVSDTQITATAPFQSAGPVDVTVTTAATSAPSAADQFTFISVFPGQYTPLPPFRILDTRSGIGGFPTVGAGKSIDVQVAGVAGSGVPVMTSATPPSAVILNVTVTNPTASGYLTLYPTGVPRPLASNLNFVRGQTVPNLVEVALGSGGKVTAYNSAGSTDVIFDVAGWVSTQGTVTGTAGLYRPLVPGRLMDTRSSVGGSPTLAAGQTVNLQVTGQQNVPVTGVSAVVLNVTATNTTAAGYLTVFPAGAGRPVASNLNFVAGQTVPNRVVVKVGNMGQVSLFNFSGAADVIVDVGGWFTDGSDTTATGGQFTGLTPARILDSRFGQGTTSAVGANGLIMVQVAGLGSVPPMTATVPPKAVVLNVTVTNTTAASFLTVYPSDAASRPTASDLNWTGGLTVPNLVVVKLGADGKIAIYNLAGSTDVIADVVGWYN
jgi:hypothetical protein